MAKTTTPAEEPLEYTVAVDTTTTESEKKYKKPTGLIEATCDRCGRGLMLFVNDPDIITHEERQALFLARKASYDPPRCMACHRNKT